MSQQFPTPDEVERALTSDRLQRVEARLEGLEQVARASDSKLERLVELSERRDKREEARAEREADEQKASRQWLRSLVSREVIIPLLGVLGGLVAGSAGRSLALGNVHPTPSATAATTERTP